MKAESNITAIQQPYDPISRPSSSSTQLPSDSAEPSSDADLTTLGADLATLDADLARITADADLATSDIGKTPPGSITIVNAAPGKRKRMKQKMEAVTVVKKERKRNFTAEEVQVIMQEAGKNTTVIKGRFTLTITSEAKEKVWISITKSVNSINGKGEGNGGMFGRNRSTPHALQGRSSATLTRSSKRLTVAQAQHPLSAR